MAKLWPGAWNYEISSRRNGAIQSEQQTCPDVGYCCALLDGEVRMYPGIAATLDCYVRSRPKIASGKLDEKVYDADKSCADEQSIR